MWFRDWQSRQSPYDVPLNHRLFVAVGAAMLALFPPDYWFSDGRAPHGQRVPEPDITTFALMPEIEGAWKRKSVLWSCNDFRTPLFRFGEDISVSGDGKNIVKDKSVRYFRKGDEVIIEFGADEEISRRARALYKMSTSSLDLLGVWANGSGGYFANSPETAKRAVSMSYLRCS